MHFSDIFVYVLLVFLIAAGILLVVKTAIDVYQYQKASKWKSKAAEEAFLGSTTAKSLAGFSVFFLVIGLLLILIPAGWIVFTILKSRQSPTIFTGPAPSPDLLEQAKLV